MKSRGKPPQPGTMAAPARTPSPARPQDDQPSLLVDDHLEPRVRIPADLLRSVVAIIEIGLLVGLALLATRTTSGVEFDVVTGSRHLPAGLLNLIGFAASVALPILPLALAIRLVVLRQFSRLAEAVITGGITVGVLVLINFLIRQPAASTLYNTLHAENARSTVDAYLGGLVAYVTVIGLRGRSQWRSAYLIFIGFYAVANLANKETTILSLLITLAIGSGVGSGLRYALGTVSGRPTAADIASALSTPASRIIAIRRVGNGGSEVRRYAATTASGKSLDVNVYDRDQQAADAFYRLYRMFRLKANVSRSAPLSLEGALERQALLAYATEDSGVRTPRLEAVIKVGPDAAALATDHVDGTTLGELGERTTDDQLRRVWDTVLKLHSHRVTHRALTEDRIMFVHPSTDHGGEVALLDPGNGDVAATDLQFRLDLVQLIAQMALVVGAERAANVAIEKVPKHELLSLVPLLQPVVLYRSTRAALRRRKAVLADLRKRLTAAAPDGQVEPVQLERFRGRTLITLIASVFALYILSVQLADVSFSKLLTQAKPEWSLAALALSAVTYIAAAMTINGFVLEKLNALRTLLVQVAGTFVILVTPAAVGHVALNVRYLRKEGVSPADAAASVGATQVVSFAVFAIVALISGSIAGSSRAAKALTPPHWAYYALAVLVGLALIVLALPAGRRLTISRIGPLLSQVVPRMLDVAQRPGKLAQGIGGTFLMMFAYILCLDASVRAVAPTTSVPIASIAVVYLIGNAAGTFIPTPGGIGAVETAMAGTLALVLGLPTATAITVVLLFRTVTFWLPVACGWLALHYLQRRDVL